MVQYNKLIDDVGKGRPTYRTLEAHVALVNGAAIAFIGAPPFPFVIKRVLTGSSVGTDISGDLDVLVLAPGEDIDTAPGTGNRVIAAVSAFADKKVHDRALTAFGASKHPANSPVVVSVVNNGVLGTGLADVIVEIDSIGTTFGAYDGQSDSEGAYG